MINVQSHTMASTPETSCQINTHVLCNSKRPEGTKPRLSRVRELAPIETLQPGAGVPLPLAGVSDPSVTRLFFFFFFGTTAGFRPYPATLRKLPQVKQVLSFNGSQKILRHIEQTYPISTIRLWQKQAALKSTPSPAPGTIRFSLAAWSGR
jgi:hypothetical protein